MFKNINKLNNNVIFGNVDKKVYGIYELSKNEFGVQYFVNNRSFMQVNDEFEISYSEEANYNLVLSMEKIK